MPKYEVSWAIGQNDKGNDLEGFLAEGWEPFGVVAGITSHTEYDRHGELFTSVMPCHWVYLRRLKKD